MFDAFRGHARRESTVTLIALLSLLGGFWYLYFHIGMAMYGNDTLRNNMFFHSDIARVIGDMTHPTGSHARTNVHPLFVLIAQPIGLGLTYLLKSPSIAAVLFNSFVGGLCVALSFLFFRISGVSLRRSLLGALLLGTSASHLYFGSAPETFMFSCLSIILLFFCIARKPADWRYFFPAGLFSFGILITNLAMVAITFGVSTLRRARWIESIWRTGLLTVCIVVVTAGLALVQRQIWPGSLLFFLPTSLVGESRFQPDHRTITKVVHRDAALLRYVLVFDFFAPKTYIASPESKPAIQIYTKTLKYLPRAGKNAAALWGVFLLAGVWLTFTHRLYRSPVILGLMLCILYNLVLHTLYGDDLFLYSCNTCFTLVAWVVLSLSTVNSQRVALLADFGLLVVVVAEIVNNVSFAETLATTPRLTV